jgi:cytochrome c peroxidase
MIDKGKIQPLFVILLGAFLLVSFIGFQRDTFFSEKVSLLMKKNKLKAISLSQMRDTTAVYNIGKQLFYDNRLSRNNNISCASCHVPEKGLSNGLSKGIGTHGNMTKRNVPHLYNLTFNQHFFWDGRANSLQEQLDKVVSSKDELDMSYKEIIERLKQDTAMIRRFEQAFPKDGLSKKTLCQSIIAYEKGFLLGDSDYDRYLGGDTNALNVVQKRGLEVFVGKANCVACHFGSNLSDGLFHNVGVRTDDIGRAEIDKIGMSKEFESNPYPFFSTFKAFRTPSLRNVSNTSPYFHDGSKKTLREVVDSYNKGGDNPDKTGLAKEMVPLHLTEEEIDDLLAFLDALSTKQTY